MQILGEPRKKKIIVLAFVAVVVLSALFIFRSGGDWSGGEAQAVELADDSDFGKALALVDNLYQQGNNCTFNGFIALMESKGKQISQAEREGLQIAFEKAKECTPFLRKEAEKIGENEYRVFYYFEMPGTCTDKNAAKKAMASMYMGLLASGTVAVELDSQRVERPPISMPIGEIQVDSWKEFYNYLTETAKNTNESDCLMLAELAESLRA